MAINITSIKTSSNGVWQGDNPLDYAFPLLIVQTVLVLVISRFLTFLLKPLRQPKVIAEIVGGIFLGPSAFGRNQYYMQRIFPKWSAPILDSVAGIGLLFFLFLVGLELDLSSIRRSGRKAFAIAAAGISLPFILGIGIAFLLRSSVPGADHVGYAQYLVFTGVALSITAFPVLARILAELKLLTTRVGETAMAAAAFNDLAAWILLALAIALAGDGGTGPHKSPMVSVWVLLSGAAFVAFMVFAIMPAMNWVARRSSQQNDTVDEAYICLTLAGVMVAGFVTDFIGIHAIFGAFVFGLTIPKDGDFAGKLIEKIEDFVSGLLLPLYFASSGLKTDVAKIRGIESWGLLAVVITAACGGKVVGTFAVAVMCRIPARESLTLGVLMNTKGLVELIVLNIGKEKKVLNDEVFAILVLMALFTTFMTTPTVLAIYKPTRGNCSKPHRRRQYPSSESIGKEQRVIACVHGPGNVPSLVKLIELTLSGDESRLKLYIMRLVELTERSSSIAMVQRVRRNGFPLISRFRQDELRDRVAVALQGYSQLGRFSFRTGTALSPLPTMHEDICHVAEYKSAAMIVLPFHRRWRKTDGGDCEVDENVGHGWGGVNRRVMDEAPCTVAVLVDRGFGGGSLLKVAVLFSGGPDDREALEFGGKLAENPAVRLTVIRFVEKDGMEKSGVVLGPSQDKLKENNYSFSIGILNRDKEKELDDGAVAKFRRRWEGTADYIEKAATNIVEAVLAIGRSKEYELIIVGREGRCRSTNETVEHAELGPIGNLLAASGHGVTSSVLVIQRRAQIKDDTIIATV